VWLLSPWEQSTKEIQSAFMPLGNSEQTVIAWFCSEQAGIRTEKVYVCLPLKEAIPINSVGRL
jgi:hypothetical protein